MRLARGQVVAVAALVAASAYVLHRRTGSRHADRPVIDPPLVVAASSALGDALPALAVDGRTQGTLPFAWRATPTDRDRWLELKLAAPMGLEGVLVRSSDESRPTVTLDGRRVASAIHGPAGLWLFLLPRPEAAQTVRVSQAGALAEVALWLHGDPAWLIEPDAGDDWSAEILRGHGLPIRRVPVSLFEQASARISAETGLVVAPQSLSPRQTSLLRSAIEQGRRLVELGPLSAICGQAASPSLAGRQLLSPPSPDPAAGGRADGLRFLADRVPHQPQPGDPAPEVELVDAGGHPALVHVALGRGHCHRWLGDLPRAIERLRQGNPALANQDTNGREGLQPQDLFAGWTEPADFATPSADRLIELSIARLAPALRFHPLPAGEASLVVLTVDQDFVPDEGVLALSKDAQDLPLTVMLTDGAVGSKPDVTFPGHTEPMLSRDTAERLAERAHDLGLHPNLIDLRPEAMKQSLATQARRFASTYRLAPRAVRNHHLRWAGYVDMARWQAQAGLRLNLDFVALAFQSEGDLGFLNASGYPLRFAEAPGALLPILQQGTQVDDHVFLPARFGYRTMDHASLGLFLDGLLQRARGPDPSPITVNHHPAWWHDTQGRFLRALRTSAQRLGIPVVSAQRWLDHVLAVQATLVARDPASGRLRVLAGGPDVAVLVPDAEASRPRVLGGRRYRVHAVEPRIGGSEIAP